MRKARSVRPLTLDAGALVAYERNDRGVRDQIQVALDAGAVVMVPAGALAQVWRDGRRQASLSALLKERQVHVANLDELAAKDSGELCGRTGTRDVVDASVVVCARGQRGGVVLTGDSTDIRRLDGTLEVQRV